MNFEIVIDWENAKPTQSANDLMKEYLNLNGIEWKYNESFANCFDLLAKVNGEWRTCKAIIFGK